jgi:pSer/pThr/pTyr-binding forkhead associated (FHA) protein
MKLFKKIRPFEAKIGEAVDSAARRVVGERPREPLEVLHAILDAIENEIQAGGRGQHVFPFTHVTVMLSGPTALARARVRAVADTEPTLATQIRQRLTSAGCEADALAVELSDADAPDATWTNPDFQLIYSRDPERRRTLAALSQHAVPMVQLTIIQGAATSRRYALQNVRINIGRGLEVRDERNQLVRTNDVAFLEASDGPNPTVSRRHAHIRFDVTTAELRLFDDRSERGTGIVRSGRTIGVPPGTRGVRLQSGDRIVLGDAHIDTAFT